jgi:hypothetical protein
MSARDLDADTSSAIAQLDELGKHLDALASAQPQAPSDVTAENARVIAELSRAGSGAYHCRNLSDPSQPVRVTPAPASPGPSAHEV